MRQRIITILSGVAVLLCVATCVLWVRSYRQRFGWMDGERLASFDFGYIWSGDGRLLLFLHRSLPTPTAGFHYQALGWEYQRYYGGGNGWDNDWEYTAIYLPFDWLFAGFALALAGLALMLFGRKRSIENDDVWCARCGYNLRATRERCPECGAVPMKMMT